MRYSLRSLMVGLLVSVPVVFFALCCVNEALFVSFFFHNRARQQAAAQEQFRQLQTKLDAYYAGHGTYPMEDHAREFLPMDPWGGEIKYSLVSKQDAKIQSAGEDGVFNTGDDISVACRPPSEKSNP